MKTCPNCRCVYEDDYNGSCTDCGKGLSGVSANNSGGGGSGNDLQFRYANQIARGARESSQEMSMRRGRYDGVQIPEGILNAARSLDIVQEAVERAKGNQNAT